MVGIINNSDDRRTRQVYQTAGAKIRQNSPLLDQSHHPSSSVAFHVINGRREGQRILKVEKTKVLTTPTMYAEEDECAPLHYPLDNITRYVFEKLGERCAMVRKLEGGRSVTISKMYQLGPPKSWPKIIKWTKTIRLARRFPKCSSIVQWPKLHLIWPK